jgi:hypothetical protein
MVETKMPPSWDGSVVLDIGGHIGALVLHVSQAFAGREIEVDPVDAATPHTHSAVRERHLAAGTTYAAVYPSLEAGDYVVEGSGQVITIEGGRVTEVSYSPAPRSPRT